MTARPFGTWPSPITPALITSDAVALGAPSVDAGARLWLERRPSDGGRSVLVRDGVDLTPPPWNVRSRVHEYGGGAHLAEAGVVLFVNHPDQRVWRIQDGVIRALTPEGPARYADLGLDRARGRVLAVEERHDGAGEPANRLVAIPLAGGDPVPLAAGADFYAAPRLSPDGRRLAWLEWDHPDMPWDAARLMLAEVEPAGGLADPRRMAGGDGVAAAEPRWTEDGDLLFLADPGGWTNLYRWRDGLLGTVVEGDVELGVPHWTFAAQTYDRLADGRIAFLYRHQGRDWLGVLEADAIDAAGWRTVETGFTQITGLVAEGDRLLLVAAAPDRPTAVVSLDPASGAVDVVKSATAVDLPAAVYSRPLSVMVPTGSGVEAHVHYWPPASADFVGPAGTRPPLIVTCHGGPTGVSIAGFDLMRQFWTSRGFAVADVNYRGSAGFGRAYRELLRGAWGVADVEDCVACARTLAERGLADPDRLIVRGGSAGGYTVLAALCFHAVFKAGASYYGVGDLTALASDTHKFEARYLDGLIGPWPAAEALYRARSPVVHADRIGCPVIFFQGLDDRVVPPNQTEATAAALRARGIACEVLMFADEGHGFRKAATIERCLEAELAFYTAVLGLGV